MPTSQTRAVYQAGGAVTDQLVYEVPSGKVAVINDISLTNTSGSAVTIDVKIDYEDGGTRYSILDDYSLSANETYDMVGVKILKAADTLELTTSASGVDMWVSIVEIS